MYSTRTRNESNEMLWTEMSSDFLLFYDGVIKLRVVRVPRIEFRMADRVLHLGRWKLIYTGRKEVKRRRKRRRRREVGKIVGSGEERETEREREKESWYLRWRLCVCIDALWGPWYQRGRFYNEPYTVYSV